MNEPRPSADLPTDRAALAAELKKLRGENQELRQLAADPTLDSRLAAIVESSDDAIVSKNLDGIIRTLQRSREAGFETHITKPINFQSLREAVRKHALKR